MNKALLLSTALFLGGLIETSAQLLPTSDRPISVTPKNLDGGLRFNPAGGRLFTPAEEDFRLRETFETYDGTASNWLPEGWTEINTSDELAAMNNGVFTWHCFTPDYNTTLPWAEEGSSYAVVFYAYSREGETTIDYDQDEWLVSPAFTPLKDDALSFQLGLNPLFIFDMSDENVTWGDNPQFINKKPSTTMQVMIKATDETEWTMLKDVYDDWKDKELKELMDSYMSNRFYPQEISLRAFEGKEVQVAFRFVGRGGNTMELDDIKVCRSVVTAEYLAPSGSLYFSRSLDFEDYLEQEGDERVMVPPFTDVAWRNVSSDNAVSFSWSDERGEASEDRDFTTDYAAGATDDAMVYASPTLTAKNLTETENTYQWNGTIQAGGMSYNDDMSTYYGLSSYPSTDSYYLMTTENNLPYFGNFSGIDNLWGGLIEESKLIGVANGFDKPAAPYILENLWVNAVGEMPTTGSLYVTVFTMSQYGMPIKPVLASGYCEASDVTKTMTPDGEVLTLPFTIRATNADGTAFTNNPIVVSEPIMVAVNGFEQFGNKTFGFLQTMKPARDESCHGSFWLSYPNADGQTQTSVLPVSSFQNADGPCNNSFLFHLGASFPWLHAEENTFAFPLEGGSHDFRLLSSYDTSNCGITISGNSGGWVTTKLTDGNLKVTVAEGKGLTEDRKAVITLNAVGVSEKIEITQSHIAGINEIKNENARFSIDVLPGGFRLNGVAPETEVTLFDASGRCTLKDKIAENGYLSTNGLSAGVYLLKAGNMTTKVVRR